MCYLLRTINYKISLPLNIHNPKKLNICIVFDSIYVLNMINADSIEPSYLIKISYKFHIMHNPVTSTNCVHFLSDPIVS